MNGTQVLTPVEGQRLLVPINDASTMLGGIGRTTLYELVKRGEIVKVSIGTRAFVTAESMRAYVGRLAAEQTA